MRRTIALTLTAVVALTSCHKTEEANKADIEKELKHSGVGDLAKSIENDHFTPPKDGKLTDAQIQIYLKVRDREKAIAKVAREQIKQHADSAKKDEHSVSGMMEGFKAMGAAADFVTADIRAAKDLGYNTQEYIWIKGQILSASATAGMETLTSALNASLESTYQQIKKQYDDAKDEQTKSALKISLDQLEQQRAAQKAQQPQVDPAVTYNKQLLSKYENVLKALTSELEKYEDKPGQTQKSMDEFQKNANKANQDSKKGN